MQKHIVCFTWLWRCRPQLPSLSRCEYPLYPAFLKEDKHSPLANPEVKHTMFDLAEKKPSIEISLVCRQQKNDMSLKHCDATWYRCCPGANTSSQNETANDGSYALVATFEWRYWPSVFNARKHVDTCLWGSGASKTSDDGKKGMGDGKERW